MTKQTTIRQVPLLSNTLDLREGSDEPMAGKGQLSLLRHCNFMLHTGNVCQHSQ